MASTSLSAISQIIRSASACQEILKEYIIGTFTVTDQLLVTRSLSSLFRLHR